MNVPPQFKALKKYIREAKKFDKVEPVIAYYCRLFAVMEAMKIDKTSPEANAFIGGQMSEMEEVKKSEKWDTSLSKEDQKIKIEEMSLIVFGQADKVDRANKANKKTAVAFNTAYVLMDILKQFGDREIEIETKAKYALYKTGDILKAIKEGRQPQPGGPGDPNSEEQKSNDASATDMGMGGGLPDISAIQKPIYDGGGLPSATGIITAEPANMDVEEKEADIVITEDPQPQPSGGFSGHSSGPFVPAPGNPRPIPGNLGLGPVNRLSPTPAEGTSEFEARVLACMKAEENMKHAFSAMRFNDANAACSKLRDALQLLMPYETANSVRI